MTTRTLEQRRVHTRLVRAKERDRVVRNNLKQNYGMSLEDKVTLAARQNFQCAICLEVKPLCVDHDHLTGVIRGLLCSVCNLSLGGFQDNPVYLTRAISYLKGS